MQRRRVLLLSALAWGAPRLAQAAPARRVVVLGGTVTEIIEALQAFDRLVGVDASSLYPAAARKLPQVGYYRNFSVEGVVSLQPDLILASEHAGPPQALEQLRRLGLRVVGVPSSPNLESLHQGIAAVAAALELDERGRALARRVDEEIAQAQQTGQTRRPGSAAGRPMPRVLVLSSHTGRLQAAGRETAAHALLALAGAQNLFGDHSGYKAVSTETVAALAPDVIVTTTLSTTGSGGLAAFIAQPGIAVTPAARAGRVVVIDDLLLLGFGPRIGQALRQLQAGLAGQDASAAK